MEERRGRARSGHPRNDLLRGGSEAERGRPPPTTLRHGCAGDARGGAGARRRGRPAERSGATQEGGNTHPAGQRAERAEGRGDGGEGAGGQAYARGRDPTTRLRAQRTRKKRRRGNFRARTGREPSNGERPDQRAEASVASRSESDPTSCPPLVARGAAARRHAEAAVATDGPEASGSEAQPPEERDAKRKRRVRTSEA